MRPQNWSSRVFTAFSRRSNQRPVSVSKLLELKLQLQALEDRTTPAVFTVTNTNDSLAGSLRQAILDANATGVADTINFNIGGGGVHTITPASVLPFFSGPVTIDGYSQPGASANNQTVGDNAVLQIELDGSLVAASNYGLNFSMGAVGSSVRGLAVNRFQEAQIAAFGNNVTIAGNFIGTNVAGTAVLGGSRGILVNTGTGTIIGGPNPADRNVVSIGGAGLKDGIILNFDTGTTVRNNYIGTNAAGTSALGNHDGVSQGFSNSAVIRDNVIAGSTNAGIYVDNTSTSTALGNLIGTDATGTSAMANNYGVFVVTGSTAAVGDGTAAGRNTVSGNTLDGVYTTSTTTSIRGNYIGTKADGLSALGNGRFGVNLSSTGSTLGGLTGTAGNPAPGSGDGNVISGNIVDGVFGGSNNKILGNIIGLDKNGGAVVANGRYGILVTGPNDLIGGIDVRARNVISGNQVGIYLANAASTNTIQNNYVGTDVTGTLDKGNSGDGILTAVGANANLIVGNLVSGNDATGILVESDSNKVQGNRVGTKADGNSALANSVHGVWVYGGSSNVIGVDGDGVGDATEGNQISGNSGAGVYFQGDSNNNVIAGNLIGTNAAGTGAIANTSSGIAFLSDFLADNTRIGTNADGTSDALERNVISGNNAGSSYGIVDFGIGTLIAGNYVGTTADGLSALGNTQGGISLGSKNATVGGTATASRNVISGNGGFGVAISTAAGKNNTILGNYIGTDNTGKAAVANTAQGVFIQGGASNNTIGTTNIFAVQSFTVVGAGAPVLLSYQGIFTSPLPANPTAAQVQAALNALSSIGGVGGTVSVTQVGNVYTVTFGGTLAYTTNPALTLTVAGVAGTVNVVSQGRFAGNVVSGNNDGIYLSGVSNNTVLGNYIGTTAAGTGPLGNQRGVSIVLGSTGNIIGTSGGGRNIISGNTSSGVHLESVGTTGNTIQNNWIGLNALGTAAVGNFVGVEATFAASGNTIGGTTAGLGNVISGNSGAGVDLSAPSNLVAGNLIGTNPAGTAALANAADGIRVIGLGAGNTIGGTTAAARNVISGNAGQSGIQVGGSNAKNTIIIGNYIGTDITGTVALANAGIGVWIQGGTTGNTIGGTTAGELNIISGNTTEGVQISGTGTTGNKLFGNYIGLNSAGTSKIANNVGVFLTGNATGNFIGTDGNGVTDSTEGNVISGNTNQGVLIISADGNRIAGNYIGLNGEDTHAVPNFDGVYI